MKREATAILASILVVFGQVVSVDEGSKIRGSPPSASRLPTSKSAAA